MENIDDATSVTELIADERPTNTYSKPVHSRQAAFSLLYLFLFSVLMFTLPFATFFGVRHLLADTFHITGFPNTCYSVLAAVIVVNLIIVLYALLGYHETEYDADGNVIDQSAPKSSDEQQQASANDNEKKVN